MLRKLLDKDIIYTYNIKYQICQCDKSDPCHKIRGKPSFVCFVTRHNDNGARERPLDYEKGRQYMYICIVHMRR